MRRRTVLRNMGANEDEKGDESNESDDDFGESEPSVGITIGVGLGSR